MDSQSVSETPFTGAVNRWQVIAGILLCFSFSAAISESWQLHQVIQDRVEEFLQMEFKDQVDTRITAGNLDKRLRLRQCTQSLDVFWPPSGKRAGNVSVGVACNDEKPWKIYVQAKVSTFVNVAVLSRPVVKGEVLTADMLRFEKLDISRAGKSYVARAEALLGYRFLRNVHADKLLQPRMLEAPLMVKKGQRVTIIAKKSVLQVRMAGKALKDGSQGDIIRVQNLSSSRVVEGEVLDKGLVGIYR